MDKLLVDGYIREIGESLNALLIPVEIVQLCSSYYCMLIRILCIHFAHGLYIADVNNQHPMKSISWKSNVISLKTKKITELNKWTADTALCCTPYIRLSTKVRQQIFNITNIQNNHKYNAVFNCDASNCHSIIFDRTQFATIPEQFAISAFEWTLPNLPERISCATCAYSKKYGLITIGVNKEREKKFYRLEFDSHEYYQSHNWNWRVIKNVPKHSILHYSSNVFDDRLFVIVGDKTMSMYDLETHKWHETLAALKYKRAKCAVLCDAFTSMIYVGGGESNPAYYHYGNYDNLSSHIEYYNMVKQGWFHHLPETWMSHKNYPILWKDHSILYIASAWNDGAEYLDLRENAKMWTRVYINNMQSLSNVFCRKINKFTRLIC